MKRVCLTKIPVYNADSIDSAIVFMDFQNLRHILKVPGLDASE